MRTQAGEQPGGDGDSGARTYINARAHTRVQKKKKRTYLFNAITLQATFIGAVNPAGSIPHVCVLIPIKAEVQTSLILRTN